MNRKERREINKKLGKKFDKDTYDLFEIMLASKGIKIKDNILDKTIEQSDFKAGDKVKLNADLILSRDIGKRKKYRNFVKRNKDTIFTLEDLKKPSPIVFTFKECDDKSEIKWHFNVDELIKVDEKEIVDE